MKAHPPLPTESTATVIRRGAEATIAGGLGRSSAPVHVPLRVSTAVSGLPELVHVETGESCGLCASESIAEQARAFFGS